MAPPGLEPGATAWAAGRVRFPYVPGYLSFREGPVFLRAARRLSIRPDLWFFDGQGIAHPRGFGLAARLGVLLDRPSVGCPQAALGGVRRRRGGRGLGAGPRPRAGVPPLSGPPDPRVARAAAGRWVLAGCAYRVPEPI